MVRVGLRNQKEKYLALYAILTMTARRAGEERLFLGSFLISPQRLLQFREMVLAVLSDPECHGDCIKLQINH